MTTTEVANKFYQLAQQGKWTEIQQEFYADDIITTEPANSKNPEMTIGKKIAIQKGLTFASMIQETHSEYVKEPIVAGNLFAVALGMDITWKNKTREEFNEIAVYEVSQGKIIKEQFFMQWL
jgi:hypothetical protein